MLCGSNGTHTSKVQRQCWSCNVKYYDLDELTDPFCYVYAGPMAQIASCPNDALRQRWSYCKAYPATDFGNGITNLTKILAAGCLGLVFFLLSWPKMMRGG